MSDTAERTTDVAAEVTAWLAEHWDPELAVGEWWTRLAGSGWAVPAWPTDWYGRGLDRDDAVAAQAAIAEFGALGAPGGLGLLLAGPTILAHGTDEQKRRYLWDLVTGRRGWCQLFSEPAAGSDLAGVQARAVLDGDEWVVSGQKVWTSGAQVADLAMVLARTDPDVPKHQGLSYMVLDMRQSGVEVRPLREMTGRSMFNEVFLTEVRVPDDAVIGGRHNGWAVANTTLAFERSGLGAGAGSDAVSAAAPGTRSGDLGVRAGDFVGTGARPRGGGSGPGAFRTIEQACIRVARANGSIADPSVRQDIARLHTQMEVGRFLALRQKAARAAGQDVPGAGNLAKLSMSRISRLSAELGLRILGPLGMLHAYSPEAQDELDVVTGQPDAGQLTELALFSPGPPIYGGTDEIQKNIIGERVLGLPKEPNPHRTTPFRDLPKNS